MENSQTCGLRKAFYLLIWKSFSHWGATDSKCIKYPSLPSSHGLFQSLARVISCPWSLTYKMDITYLLNNSSARPISHSPDTEQLYSGSSCIAEVTSATLSTSSRDTFVSSSFFLPADNSQASSASQTLQVSEPLLSLRRWSKDEDNLIIKWRASGETWKEISKKLSGRSPLSCRLRHQNYLEKKQRWTVKDRETLALHYARYAWFTPLSQFLDWETYSKVGG